MYVTFNIIEKLYNSMLIYSVFLNYLFTFKDCFDSNLL